MTMNEQGGFLQAMEQSEAFLRDFAGVLATYRDSLMARGFTRTEAMQVVINYQATMVGASMRGARQDGEGR